MIADQIALALAFGGSAPLPARPYRIAADVRVERASQPRSGRRALMSVPDGFRPLLASTAVACVSTIGKRGEPKLSPIWFLFDGDRVRSACSRAGRSCATCAGTHRSGSSCPPDASTAIILLVLRIVAGRFSGMRDQPRVVPSAPDDLGSGRRIMRNELNNPMRPARIGMSKAT